MEFVFANRMDNINSSAVSDFLKHAEQPGVISFSGGFPSPDAFPVQELIQVYRDVLEREGGTALQYSSTDGYLPLREKLAERMGRAGIRCGAEHVFMLQGAQQGLDFVAKMLLNDGDKVIVESPTFIGGMLAFNPYLPTYIPVPVDETGMDLGALEKALKEHPDTKFIYTIPEFQNPGGYTMGREKRKLIVEIANRFGVIILEDSPYREIRYEGEPLPAIKSFDTENLVIHLGTFSKILSPGMRLGWAVADEEIIRKLSLIKQSADTQTSTISQRVANRYLELYDIDAHIGEICKLYRRKRDLMLDAMEQEMPEGFFCTKPEGGLFTWLTCPEHIDTKEVLDKAIKEESVAFVPGEGFFPYGEKRNHCRINYSMMADDAIVEGVKRLGRVFRQFC